MTICHWSISSTLFPIHHNRPNILTIKQQKQLYTIDQTANSGVKANQKHGVPIDIDECH